MRSYREREQLIPLPVVHQSFHAVAAASFVEQRLVQLPYSTAPVEVSIPVSSSTTLRMEVPAQEVSVWSGVKFLLLNCQAGLRLTGIAMTSNCSSNVRRTTC